MKDAFKDKRILVIYIIVGIALLSGITYALNEAAVAFNVTTGIVKIDESAYGNTSFNSSNLEFIPIFDADIKIKTNNVIKIDFKVGGNSANTASNIIYDIALNDLKVNCSLISPYVKWQLFKNGSSISIGSLDYGFDTIVDGRLVLTNTQQDLPAYSASKSGYDSYTFYMWISDSCQNADISTCASAKDQTDLLGKSLMGKVEVELYTKSKKALVRKTRTSIDSSSCTNDESDFSVLLKDVAPGSYVKYVGSNGCSGKACEGQNANYVSDTDMGYCFDVEPTKFAVNGWRIAYTADDTAYLVSAGAPECLCTNSDGTTSNSSCSSSEATAGVPKHLANLNNAALKYCNSTYAYGGVCNSLSAWNMNATDFEKVVGKPLSNVFCYYSSNDTSCGYGNDLIDNGSFYWFATSYDASSTNAFNWVSYHRLVSYASSSALYGGRPVLRLKSSVVATGGSGTYKDPYIIKPS